MQDIRTNAGRTIRKIRNVCGRTLEGFAADTGYCRSRLSVIERNGTMDLETMMRINRYSGKSIFSFIADILPCDMRNKELSLWLTELKDETVTDMIESESAYRESAEKKKELSKRADTAAADIISYGAGFEADERYVKHILSLTYHYDVICLKSKSRLKKNGTIIAEGDKEFYQLMEKTIEKLCDLAVKAENHPDADVFGWIDYSFPSYTFPYVKELSGLSAIYQERLLKAAWYRLDDFVQIKFPDRKKRKTIRKSLL